MRTGSLVACMAVVTAALGAGAASAAADTINFDVPISAVVTSDCTGEAIAISGTMHVKQTDNSTLGGIKFQIETNLTGVTGTTVAPVAGVKYVMNNQTSDMEHADVDDAQVTVETTMLLTRQRETGTFPLGGDDLRLHVLMHFTVVNGVTKADKSDLRADCQ
jgi:hypothetical protein